MKNRSRILWPLVVLALGASLLGLMMTFKRPVTPEPRQIQLPLVRVRPLSPTNHQFHVLAQGTVSPRTEIDLVAEVSGRIVRIAPSFDPGGFFKQGEELVVIDPRDYELAVTRARATLAQAETARQRVEAEAEVARDEWKRLGEGEPGPLLLREPQLAEAKAAVDSAKANLQIAERDLERCRVMAPFEGRVRTKRVDIGQFVNRGTPLARVYAVDYVEVRLPLTLEDLAYVDLPLDAPAGNDPPMGPAVRLAARVGGRQQVWAGRVVRTEGEVDPRTRMLTVVARVDDPYGRQRDVEGFPLAVGLFVEADIIGRMVKDVYLAPRAALRSGVGLMVVDAANRLRFRDVEVLRREAGYVVFRDGIQPGDRVCVSPLDVATDGMQVRVLAEGRDAAASVPMEAPAPVEEGA